MTKKNFDEALKRVLGPILQNIADPLSTALNRRTEVHLGEIRPVDMEELQASFTDEVVLARAAFTEGISDQISFLLLPKWAAIWADLMLMGEGQAEFSAEEHLDSVAELLNQVGGVMCQYLSDVTGTSVKLGPIEATLGSVESQADAWQSFFRTEFILEIEGFDQANMTLLLSPQTVNDLQNLNIEDEPADEDRPPPAVLDEDEDVGETPEVRSARFEDFGPAEDGGAGSPQSIETLMDLELPVIIELGRTAMFIRDILELSPGSIVELNKLSGEPVDLYINDKKFARGEVMVVEENFGIRITDLVRVEDRIRTLK